MMMGYYDRAGDALTFDEWVQLSTAAPDEPDSYRVVGRDMVEDPAARRHLISTVWLGIDHGFGSTPLIFETMVFCDHDDPCEWDQWQARYSSETDAAAGHSATTIRVRSGEAAT